MSGRLEVDTTTLRSAGRSLAEVTREFRHAASTSDTAADDVGNPALADQVRDFAGSWEIARDEMLTSIQTLADHISATAETFDEIDRAFTEALGSEG